HRFFVDGDGRKMSKSLGNVIGLDDLLPKYGAEILRLWVAAEDYTQDIRVSREILDRLADAYRRIRNTFRFLLGNLSDFDPARDRQSYARLDEVDRWILDRLGRLVGRVTRAYETYELHTVFHAVHNFCAVDLSAQYLDIIKDRLYTSAADDPRPGADRQRARGPPARRRGAGGPARAAPRQARAPAHALHRVAGRARRGAHERGRPVREPGDPRPGHRRGQGARPQVPALLDVERAGRRAPRAPRALRALRAGGPRQRQCELSGVREASGDRVRGMTPAAPTRVAVLAGVV